MRFLVCWLAVSVSILALDLPPGGTDLVAGVRLQSGAQPEAGSTGAAGGSGRQITITTAQ